MKTETLSSIRSNICIFPNHILRTYSWPTFFSRNSPTLPHPCRAVYFLMPIEQLKAQPLPDDVWRCPVCRVRNPLDCLKCRACDAAAPHATPEALAKAKEKEDAAKLAATLAKPSGFAMSSTGFAFGSSSTSSSSTATGSSGLSTGGFKFGTTSSSSDAPATTGGFKFGTSSNFTIPEGGLKIAAATVPASASAASTSNPLKRAAPSGSSAGSKPFPGFIAAAARAALIAPDNGAAAAASDKAKAAAAPLKKKLEKKQGVVMVMGSGDMSQLGLGRQIRERRFPALVKTLAEAKVNIVDIGVGALHNLAVTDKGEVYSWGCNDDGAIGRTTKEDASEMLPDKVEGLEGVHVVKVSCGASHSLALTDNGEVYSWGAYRDASGLVGFNTAEKRQMQAQRVDFPAGVKIVQLAAGESHSLALDSDGHVWYWGDVFIGRRMTDRLKRERLSPRKVHFPPKPRKGSKAFASANLADWKIVKVFAGGYSSFAVGESGNVRLSLSLSLSLFFYIHHYASNSLFLMLIRKPSFSLFSSLGLGVGPQQLLPVRHSP